MMAFTVVLIPVSLLGMLVAVFVLAFASLAYGRLAGEGLNRAAGRRLSMRYAPVLGTIPVRDARSSESHNTIFRACKKSQLLVACSCALHL